MAFNHRKLISVSSKIKIYDVCELFCDLTKTNTHGFCPTSCLSWCPSICFRPLISLIQPPDPPTTTTTSDPNQNPEPPPLPRHLSLHSGRYLLCLFLLHYLRNSGQIKNEKTPSAATRGDPP
ncbi:RING-type E3 ubiquitin transferase [Sarracenia purpurea var. burkii]